MTYKSDLGFMQYGWGLTPQVSVPITQQGQKPPMPHAVTNAGSNTYTYDNNGNMLSGPNKLMTYDSENRMISLETATETTLFTYDSDGSRIKKQTGTNTTTYISSLFEIESTGGIGGTFLSRKHIFAGANRVCTITVPSPEGGEGQGEGKTVAYYHGDHLGSSNIITDGSGAQVQYCEYTPYGTFARNELSNGQTTQATNRYFTGKELDNTGLYYYGARYYDPVIARFITPDAFVQAPYDPQTLNRYNYCRNNPIKYTDPSGHFFWIAAIIGAIVGAVLGGISAAQSGQEIWKGMLAGAISGFGAGFGNFYAAVAWGAFSGAGGAALNGGNILQGALLGGASTAVGWGFGSLAKGNVGTRFLASTATGAVMGGVSSELAGGNFGEGAMWGALYSGVGFVASTLAHGAYNNSQTKTKIQRALLDTDVQKVANIQKAEQLRGDDTIRRSALATPSSAERSALTTNHTKNAINWKTVGIGIGEVIFGIGAIAGSLISGTAATAATGGIGVTIAVVGAGAGISSGVSLFALGMGEIANGLTGGAPLSREVIKVYYDSPPVVDTINIFD